MQDQYNLYEFLRCPADSAHSLEQRFKEVFCSQCRMAYPVKDNRVIFTDYPENAFVRDIIPSARYTRWRKSNYDYFLRNLEFFSKEKVLFDIGAGPTDFRNLLLGFSTYVGVDFYPYELVSVVTDLTKTLPFRNASCDIIFMSNVLEHISNPILLLQECYRILRPGGLIIGTVPFLLNVHQVPYDFYRYTNFMLEKMFKNSGFSNVEITSLGTPLDVYQTMQNNFFNLLMQSKFSENKVVHHGRRFFARLGRKIIYSAFFLFRPVFKLAPASYIYTQGYGFKAIK